MKILISGGTGLIGSAFAGKCIAAGHQVTILTRNTGIARSGNPTISYWDGQSPESCQTVVDGSDAVVHLAGENIGGARWTKERKERIILSRLESGTALAKAIEKSERRPSVFVQASAIGAYGVDLERTFDETSPMGTDFLAGICKKWEDSTLQVENAGLRRMIIRTGVVLARTQGALPRMALPFKFFVGGPIGSGKQWLSWISLEDEVKAILFLIEHPECSGIYNLTSPNPARNVAFSRTMARVLRKPYWMPAPAIAVKLLFGEMSTLVLDGQKVLPTRLLSAGYPFKHSDLEPALEDVL